AGSNSAGEVADDTAAGTSATGASGEGSAELDATDDSSASAETDPSDDSMPEASDIESLEPEPAVDPDDPFGPATAAKIGAYDIVELGNTGIKVSRLAMGSGTV